MSGIKPGADHSTWSGGRGNPPVAASIGLRDAGSQPLGKTVRAYLRERAVLLVADNLEHLLPDAALTIAGLLADGPRLRILATSRAPVQVPGEQLLPLAPLGVPGSGTASPLAVADSPAVSLFVERVRAVVPDFELTGDNARDVAEICITPDGLPLALELAAPHVRTLGLAEVLTRSRHRYELLSLPRRAAPHRHRSLASAVRWSADLLAPPARRAFEELSMFTGGWTADAAAEVCGEQARPALADLVDQSLVEMRPSPAGPRYHMLETLREWAARALAERGATDKAYAPLYRSSSCAVHCWISWAYLLPAGLAGLAEQVTDGEPAHRRGVAVHRPGCPARGSQMQPERPDVCAERARRPAARPARGAAAGRA